MKTTNKFLTTKFKKQPIDEIDKIIISNQQYSNMISFIDNKKIKNN